MQITNTNDLRNAHGCLRLADEYNDQIKSISSTLDRFINLKTGNATVIITWDSLIHQQDLYMERKTKEMEDRIMSNMAMAGPATQSGFKTINLRLPNELLEPKIVVEDSDLILMLGAALDFKKAKLSSVKERLKTEFNIEWKESF